MSLPQFQENPNRPGELVALNDEAKKIVAGMNRSRAAALISAGVTESELAEARIGYMKKTADVIETQASLIANYQRLGLSLDEAKNCSWCERS